MNNFNNLMPTNDNLYKLLNNYHLTERLLNKIIMKIEKSIIINKSSRLVFDYLKMTRNQDNFSVWNMADPKMKKSYIGTDGKVGFKYSWDSILKNVGAGEQEIAAIDDGKSIDYTIRFSRPMQNTGKTRFQITSLGIDNTSVAWTFDSPSRFPMSLFSPIFKRMLGKDLATGLQNLKVILEK